MKKTLLSNANILTMDAKRTIHQPASLLIADNRIEGIDERSALLKDQSSAVTEVDLRDRWILPGLINTHLHTAQFLARGVADDVDLLTWLHDRIFPFESNLNEDDSYLGALATCVEQIRNGVTCFLEAGGHHIDAIGKAVSRAGMRAILARSTADAGQDLPPGWMKSTDETIEIQVADLEKWHGQADDRIRFWFNLRNPIFTSSDELTLRSKELADRHGVGLEMHAAEVPEEIAAAQARRGFGTIGHLNDLGVLDRNVLASHCVLVTDDEIGQMAAHDMKVSHNPAAAMRVLSMPRITDMIDAGVCVALGTDGTP